MSITAELEAPPAAVSCKRSKVPSAVYDVADVADLLTISERQVWRMKDAGALPPHIQVGRLVRFSRTVIDAWIAAGCPRPKGR
jgi:excisionase family DNA binding protein